MKRILIIDTEEKFRRVYKEALTIEGFDVLTVDSLDQGRIELLREDDIDLVLWGVNIKGTKDNYLIRLAQDFDLRIKVIVASVYPLNQQRNLIPGANDYYYKIESIDILIQKINRVLQY